eukprot:5242491-Alexandrium_andersonii.AAC.1
MVHARPVAPPCGGGAVRCLQRVRQARGHRSHRQPDLLLLVPPPPRPGRAGVPFGERRGDGALRG